MVKMKAVYEGDLHCRITHGPSGNVIETDAPVDNMGKGENFSPTDLLAAALGSCMLTVMGVAAQPHNIDLTGSTVEIEKEMVTQPVRRIGKIALRFRMAAGIALDKRPMLERAAAACPIQKSIGHEVEMPVSFEYPD